VSRFKVIRFIAAARVLACVLAGALLIFELLAANSEFHQALHHGGKAASNTCVVCLFAKGHADSPGLTPVFTRPVAILLSPALRSELEFLPWFDFVVSDGRAPPFNSSSTAVVG